jgi:hypothetical protein
MKALLIIGFMLITNLDLPKKVSNFTIDIFDYNYSMAYTLHYHITNDSVSVIKLNGLNAEHSVCLLQKKLDPVNRSQLLNLLSSSSFKSLKNEYKNPLVNDGDQKTVVIQLNGQKKIIEIENIYNEEIARLIYKVNRVLKDEFKIKYVKK